jgi:amino-acid N-acetyltransferase
MMINDKNLQNTAIFIEPANKSDLTSVLNLLTESRLPQAGLSDHLTTALVARAGQDVVGSAALEPYGQVALLRSVAVAPAYRGQGLGQRLIQSALELAQQHGFTYLYLLTETAAKFFPKFGFYPIDRSQVPSAVQSSIEFTSLCPDSALAMELRLETHGTSTTSSGTARLA